MPHNIYQDSIAYVGKEPWHGIGKKLETLMYSADAIRVAKLGYSVEKVSIFTKLGGEIQNHRATIRLDTSQHLGIVSPKYEILQNSDAFRFFDEIIRTGEAIYEVAGALGNGERIWILARLNKDMIIKDEKVKKYLCLTNSHDGKSALKVYFTPIRVVCQNTLNASLKDSKDGISIRHTSTMPQRIKQAEELINVSNKFYKELEEQFRYMADFSMNVENAEQYFRKVLFNQDEKKELGTRQDERIRLAFQLFEKGKGNDNPKIKHTAWAAYNAITELVDYFSNIRNLEKDPTNRLKNIWFGRGSHIKLQALKEIKSLTGIKG